MKTVKKRINNFCRSASHIMLIILPAVLFLSNFPLIKIGETDSMHLEVSLPEIWLVLFFLLTIGKIPRRISELGLKWTLVVSLIPAYMTMSILWSPNPLRALLTSGIAWLTVWAIINIVHIIQHTPNSFMRLILKSFLISSAVVCLFCWLQCFLDVFGLSREYSLLCAGCTFASFGFPHPNGFAIEPQFMGNLLIAPALYAIYRSFLKSSPNRKTFIGLSLLLTSTLFLTFSRGAIYAFIIGAILLALLSRHRKHNSLLIIPIIIVSFIISLCAQGILATLSPTSDNFISGTTKVIHQLTLGHIDFRPTNPTTQQAPEATQNSETPQEQGETEQKSTKPEQTEQSSFSGYVSESTETRVSLTNYALDIWNDNLSHIIFGTGLGSAGTVLYQKYPELGSSREIVQNEYASLLLELGIIIFILIGITFFFLFRSAPPDFFTISLISAYAVSLFFFSGLPNALHIYLFTPLLYIIIHKNQLKDAPVEPNPQTAP